MEATVTDLGGHVTLWLAGTGWQRSGSNVGPGRDGRRVASLGKEEVTGQTFTTRRLEPAENRAGTEERTLSGALTRTCAALEN